jgi:hypothetical protein
VQQRAQGNAYSAYKAKTLRPPAGTYDPGLDASQRAAGRGFNDLRQDLDRDGQRASTAYTLGTARLGEDEAFETGGLDIAQSRLGEDFGRASGRLTQDHGIATQGLQRSFRQLGVNQAGAASAAGLGGGAFAAAAKMRKENQGLEQSALDLSRDRGVEDLTTDRDRGLADITRQRGRMATVFGRAREDAGTDFQYGQDDRSTALARGGRENTFYGQDVADQRFFQASQAGWRPPARPKKGKGRR